MSSFNVNKPGMKGGSNPEEILNNMTQNGPAVTDGDGNSEQGKVISDQGKFYLIDDKGNKVPVDLGTLMMMLSLKRTENLDKLVAEQLDDMQTRNKMIAALTEYMSLARSAKADNKSFPTDVDLKGGRKLSDVLAALGIRWTPVPKTVANDSTDKKEKYNQAWETNISNIKSRIDVLNNDSQMANIKLQNSLEKRNNSFEMASKVMQTNYQSLQSIVRNL